MIFYLVQAQHARSMQYVNFWGPKPGSRMQYLFYHDLVERQRVLPGTYVFTDLETLSPGQLQLAIELCGQLAQAETQVRILNHPDRVLRRFDVLRKLYDEGVNSFRAFRACDSLDTIRFPVFLRREDDHRGSLTPLINGRDGLNRALKYMRLQGHRLADLLVVEFCDTADPGGVFRKYSAFRVANQVLPRHLIFGRSWNLKKPDLDTEDLNNELQEYLETNPHERFVADIFCRANIDYGRIDYSLVGSAPQVWEINTHPTVLRLTPRLTAAFEAIDIDNGARCDDSIPISFRTETLEQVRQETRSRAYNTTLRNAVSTVASTPLLRPVKQILKRRLK